MGSDYWLDSAMLCVQIVPLNIFSQRPKYAFHFLNESPGNFPTEKLFSATNKQTNKQNLSSATKHK